MALNAVAILVLIAGVPVVAVLGVTVEALVEVVVSEEVVEVDLGEVVAAAKEIVGRFPGAATFPTRGSRRLVFGEVSRRAHDTESCGSRAFIATDQHGFHSQIKKNPYEIRVIRGSIKSHKKYKCVSYDVAQ